MGDIRSLIRELLSEEIASIRAELLGGTSVERVSVGTEAELTDFALSVVQRAEDPAFVAALRAGRMRFAPVGSMSQSQPIQHVQPAVSAAPTIKIEPKPLVASVLASIPELRKSLITERDIAAISEGEPRLRITKQARLTPLAGDEARRRGIRIERTLA